MKKRIGRMIPYPLIEAGRRLIHAGPHRCRVCGGRVRRLGDSGYGFEVLERLQVVGGLKRRGDRCPICHATSRERLVWFWLTEGGAGFRFAPDLRIAHFAPEKGLSHMPSRGGWDKLHRLRFRSLALSASFGGAAGGPLGLADRERQCRSAGV